MRHGDPVLLLHGFPQHWWEWRKIMPGLARRYRVICPDLRGAGWSDAAADGYTHDQLRADVVALLDARALDRVHLISHDWGAIVGFPLCMSHPERVRDHVSLGVPHPYLRFDPRLLTILWRIWFQVAIATPILGPRLLGKGNQRLPRHLFRGYLSNQDALTDQDIELFLAPLRNPARARAAGALYRGLIMREAGRILRGAYHGTRLSTPTRLLIGADDPVVRPEFLGGHESHADDLAVGVVDGASHFIADERPDAVLDHALKLFAHSR